MSLETSLNLNQQAEIIITSLKNRVLKTTLILILQVFAIIGIWLYVLSMLKQWRKEQTYTAKNLLSLLIMTVLQALEIVHYLKST